MCFLCLWDSQDHTNHFKKAWEPCKNLKVGRFNLKHTPLVNLKSIPLPPLHIKLEQMKTFIKAINHDSAAFTYLKKKFGLFKSEAKLKEGVFIRVFVYDLKTTTR